MRACTAIASLVYAVMVFLMASVPLAMVGSGYSFNHSSAVVQAHMVSMSPAVACVGPCGEAMGVLKIEIVGDAHILERRVGDAPIWRDGRLRCVAVAHRPRVESVLCRGDGRTAAEHKRGCESGQGEGAGLNDCAVFGLSGTASLVSALALRGIGWAGMNAVGLGVGGLMAMAVLGLSEALERRGARKEDAGVSLTVT